MLAGANGGNLGSVSDGASTVQPESLSGSSVAMAGTRPIEEFTVE